MYKNTSDKFIIIIIKNEYVIACLNYENYNV
jgi:hypothetical protein